MGRLGDWALGVGCCCIGEGFGLAVRVTGGRRGTPGARGKGEVLRFELQIRDELPTDRAQVRAVNEAAFGRPDEADLIDALRDEGAILLSLVVEVESQIAGHILFSRMSVETAQGSIAAVSLAPMAVFPGYQGEGIGSELVRRGLDRLRDQHESIVIVLGHEHYYPRFGFSSQKARRLSSPFPPEAFMALELTEGALLGIQGTVRYAAAFGL